MSGPNCDIYMGPCAEYCLECVGPMKTDCLSCIDQAYINSDGY